jgi:hypothetical protein
MASLQNPYLYECFAFSTTAASGAALRDFVPSGPGIASTHHQGFALWSVERFAFCPAPVIHPPLLAILLANLRETVCEEKGIYWRQLKGG